MNGKRAFGDYQTPSAFATQVCSILREHKRINPSVVLEPTCGIGNFLISSLVFEASKYIGIEINSEYCKCCQNRIQDDRVELINADFFDIDISSIIQNHESVLIIGNPPWVTNSTLSTLGSNNLPHKTNLKGFKGLDAITGASNFDICEYMILHMIEAFKYTDTTICMLCKTSVARNIFKEIKRTSIPFDYCEQLDFDAEKVFGISASACVILLKLSVTQNSPDVCKVYDIDLYPNEKYTFGYNNGKFYSNLDRSIRDFEGQCCFEWRQGVKHDCSRVMELTNKDGILLNGLNASVDIEDTFLFPLVKSSMFKSPLISDFSKYVIVTQRKVKEDTKRIEIDAPKTWEYLQQHIDLFSSRKSSIYRDAPPFSMFGVGEYTFSPYKVGISGFYKKPLFSVLFTSTGSPVMTDDTGYFICFESFDFAYVAMLLLNSQPVQDFLIGIAFLDSKRPYTKKVLERISFKKIMLYLTYEDIVNTEIALNLEPYITQQMYEAFKKHPKFFEGKQISFI